MLNMALLLFSQVSAARGCAPSVRRGTRAWHAWDSDSFPRGKPLWHCWSGCLLPALIIALLVELPLGIDDLPGLLKQPGLSGHGEWDDDDNKHHKEEKNEEHTQDAQHTDHGLLLLGGVLPHLCRSRCAPLCEGQREGVPKPEAGRSHGEGFS